MTGRSKWTLLGKLVLFCLLLPTVKSKKEEEKVKESENDEGRTSQQAESQESRETSDSDENEDGKESKLPATKGSSKSTKNTSGFTHGFSAGEVAEDTWKHYAYPQFSQFAPNFPNQGGYYNPGSYVYSQPVYGPGQTGFGLQTLQYDQGFGPMAQNSFPPQVYPAEGMIGDGQVNPGGMLDSNPAYYMVKQYGKPGNGENSGDAQWGQGSIPLDNLPPGENPILGPLQTLNGGAAPGANPVFHSMQAIRVEAVPHEPPIVKPPTGTLPQGANPDIFNSIFSRTSRGK